MTDIYKKLDRLKIKDFFFNTASSNIRSLFSPEFRYWQKNPDISLDLIFPQKIEKILRFCEYANISYEDFFDIVKKKPCSENFYKYSSLKAFYEDWKIEDTALNIFYQTMFYQKYYSYIYNYFRDLKIKYCDYGCGSATNSLCLQDIMSMQEMHLYDVENASSKYLKYYIEKYNLHNTKWIDIQEDKSKFENYYDVILCCDVLEHLKNPSEIIQQLYKSLKPNSYLILSAPFEIRNIAEHIQEAPYDFYNNGGYAFLKKYFKKITHIDYQIHISGVYKKI